MSNQGLGAAGQRFSRWPRFRRGRRAGRPSSSRTGRASRIRAGRTPSRPPGGGPARAWRPAHSKAALLTAGLLAWRAAAAAGQVSVGELAALYPLHEFSVSGATARLQNSIVALELEAGSRKLLCNGVLIWLNAPCQRSGGEWLLARPDLADVLDPLLRPAFTASRAPVRTIVLDPGHGGADPGAIGVFNVCEKKLTLDIARRVAVKLADSGVTVRLTRARDVTLSLAERAAFARRWEADLLVSIHFNSSPSGAATGLETYVLPTPGYPSTNTTRSDARVYPGNRFGPQSALLAYYLHWGVLSSARLPDRGVKRARYEMLTQAQCPAALIECGFVSHRSEASRLREPAYRDLLADGIARGLLTYVSLAEAPRPEPDLRAIAAR